MAHTLYGLCFGLLLASPLQVEGQQPIPLDPGVNIVATGGEWTADSQSGFYRVIVATGGTEHLISWLQLDWVTEATPDMPARVIKSMLVDSVNQASNLLQSPRFERSDHSWRLTLLGINTHTEPITRTRWVVELGEPGRLRVLSRSP